jgi:hypothetical protein
MWWGTHGKEKCKDTGNPGNDRRHGIVPFNDTISDTKSGELFRLPTAQVVNRSTLLGFTLKVKEIEAFHLYQLQINNSIIPAYAGCSVSEWLDFNVAS